MWFSRLNRRISHSEARSLLRRVFANCTAANPPPTMTTLIGFNFLLPMAGCDVNPAFLPAHAHPLQVRTLRAPPARRPRQWRGLHRAPRSFATHEYFPAMNDEGLRPSFSREWFQ